MSLFGALNSAISGLSAQSTSFGNISNNVANSQSVGYKRVDTNFQDYLTTSTPTQNEPGSVVATPEYVNTVQGTISQTDNPLGLAISGQGFFAVSQATGSLNGVPSFDPQQYYSRAGNFTMNSSGYLVNSQGQYLNGWPVNASTGVANQNNLAPIQISQQSYNPVATTNVTLSANLPATPTTGTATSASPLSSQISVYDALGTPHIVKLDWAQNATGDWTVSIVSNDDSEAPAGSGTGSGSSAVPDYVLGSADVQFGAASGNLNVPAGTIGNITNATSTDSTNEPVTLSSSGYSVGQAATLSFVSNFGSGPQTITLNLGQIGQTTGVTQFAGNTYNLQGITQNGVAPGSFSGVSMQENGNVVVNYNNGQSRVVAQVPIVTFKAPDALQSQNGQSFTATLNSGTPLADAAGINGAGSLVTGAVENSNVDIATEFSALIVAQQAYSANAKVVTTSDQLLQTTINMKT